MNGKRDTPAPVRASKLAGPALQRAYENALHVLDRDAAILDQLRSRANILLAALAIGVTALGAILADTTAHLHLSAWFVTLAALFLGSAILCCVGVLWPTRDHGDFTAPELERARDEAAAAARIRTAAAERDAAIAAAREAIGQARADLEALTHAAELGLDATEWDIGLVAARQGLAEARANGGNEEFWEEIAVAAEARIRAATADRDAAIVAIQQEIVAARTGDEVREAIEAARAARIRAAGAEEEAWKTEQARAAARALIRFAEADARARVAAAKDRDAAIVAARVAIGQVCLGAEALILADAEVLDRAAAQTHSAAVGLAATRTAAQARVGAAGNGDDVTEAAQEEIEQIRAVADDEIRAAAEARGQARSDAEALIGAAEADSWARVLAAENRDAALEAAKMAIWRVRPGAEALILADAEALDRAATEARSAAAALAATRTAARVRIAAAVDRDDAIRRGQEEIDQVHARAEALISAAAEARDHAVAYAAVLERRQPPGERASRAWKHLTQPWREWCHAVGRDQRLWKTVLNQQDLAQVPPDGSQDEVDRVLLKSLHLAHKRNFGTLSRRADLLRVASLFVFTFVILFGIWLLIEG